MSSKFLYTNLMSGRDKTSIMLEEEELISLSRLKDMPECKMNGQIIYVNKGTRVSMFTRMGDKSKKIAKTYDRLVVLRDLESGAPFVIVSESFQDSAVLFHKRVKIGDYVTLYLPDYSPHTVADMQVVLYTDVLMPLSNPPNDMMVHKVPMGEKFAIFAVELNPKEMTMYGMGVEKVCESSLCNGTINNFPCPCFYGPGVKRFAISFKIKVPVVGLEYKYARYRSLGFTQKFFGPSVMRDLNLYDINQLRDVIQDGMRKVERIVLAGWVGYTVDADDIEYIFSTHLSSLRLILKEEDGKPLLSPNDDLQLPSFR